MEALDTAQQIKIIRNAQLKIPVYRAATEPFNPDKPTLFDKNVYQENIQISKVINVLIGIIAYLSKEHLLRGGVIPQELWTRLKDTRKLIKESQMSL